MPKPANITVNVSKQNGKIGFDLDSDHKVGKDRLEFKNDHHPGFKMTFHLRTNGTGLSFIEDSMNVFWVSKEGCPKEQSFEDDFPKDEIKVAGGGKVLHVRNLNSKEETYHFTLRFSGPEGEVEFDPIIENKNGAIH